MTPEWKTEVGGDLNDEKLVGYALSLDKGMRKPIVTSISDNPDGYKKAAHLWGPKLKEQGSPEPLELATIDKRTTRIVFGAKAPKAAMIFLMLLVVVGHPPVI